MLEIVVIYTSIEITSTKCFYHSKVDKQYKIDSYYKMQQSMMPPIWHTLKIVMNVCILGQCPIV
jgi:hypothetical protein